MSEQFSDSFKPEDIEALANFKEKTNEELLGRPLESLSLSERAYNTLTRQGVETVGQLSQCSRLDLLNIRNFGPNQVEEVKGKLAELDLTLNDEDVE